MIYYIVDNNLYYYDTNKVTEYAVDNDKKLCEIKSSYAAVDKFGN